MQAEIRTGTELGGPFAQAFMLSYQYPRLQHALQPYPADRFAELKRNISEGDPFCVRKSAALIMEQLAFASGTNCAMGSGKIAKQALEIISAHLYDPYFDVGTPANRSTFRRIT